MLSCVTPNTEGPNDPAPLTQQPVQAWQLTSQAAHPSLVHTLAPAVPWTGDVLALLFFLENAFPTFRTHFLPTSQRKPALMFTPFPCHGIYLGYTVPETSPLLTVINIFTKMDVFMPDLLREHMGVGLY